MTQDSRQQSLNRANHRQEPAPRIKQDKCTGCGLCASVCLVMEKRNKKIVITRPDLCIRCGHCGAICPSNAIVGPSVEAKRLTDRARAAAPSASSLQFLLRSRRSVRRYKNEPISQKDMDKILEAGRYTPTGTNSQGIEYIVMTDRDQIARLGKMAMPSIIKLFGMAVRVSKIPVLGDLMLGNQAAENFQKIYTPALKAIDEYTKRGDDRLFYHAPAIILVHGEKLDDMAFSCSAALFSCMLMADTLGIGCCLNGFLVLAANREPKVKKWLGIPRNHKAHAAMTLGYANVKYNHLVKRNPVRAKYL
jgi:nitroreductase/NAD-dependent dihydropyrimidine dehydrogenase PreA subunit